MGFWRDVFLKRVLPESLALAIKEDSQNWILTCEDCGFETNVFANGGIRYRAYGGPKTMRMRCKDCDAVTVGALHFRPPAHFDPK